MLVRSSRERGAHVRRTAQAEARLSSKTPPRGEGHLRAARRRATSSVAPQLAPAAVARSRPLPAIARIGLGRRPPRAIYRALRSRSRAACAGRGKDFRLDGARRLPMTDARHDRVRVVVPSPPGRSTPLAVSTARRAHGDAFEPLDGGAARVRARRAVVAHADADRHRDAGGVSRRREARRRAGSAAKSRRSPRASMQAAPPRCVRSASMRDRPAMLMRRSLLAVRQRQQRVRRHQVRVAFEPALVVVDPTAVGLLRWRPARRPAPAASRARRPRRRRASARPSASSALANVW